MPTQDFRPQYVALLRVLNMLYVSELHYAKFIENVNSNSIVIFFTPSKTCLGSESMFTL